MLLWNVALLSSCYKTAQSDPLPPIQDPYSLPTPDSLAFRGETLCGVNQYWWKYCGYSSGTRSDSLTWRFLPGYYEFQIGTDSAFGTICLNEYNSAGYPVTELQMSGIPLSVGTYFPIKKTFPNRSNDCYIMYLDLNDACSHYSVYRSDTTRLSFIKVVAYDSVKHEIMTRFRLHFVLKEAKKPGYPEKLTFDDGAVFAIRRN